MLDTLRPTATGLNLIQAWFLRLGAAIFAAPLLDCSTSHSHRAPYQTSGKLQSLRRFPRSRTAERLAADIDHAGLVAVATEVRRPEVYLSGPAPTASDARLQWPVCVQAVGLDDGCHRRDATHRPLHAGRQWLRSRLLVRFLEGIWHCPALVVDE